MYVCEESEDRNREAGRPKMDLRQRKKKGWKNEEEKKEKKDSNREGGRLKRERRAREEQGGRTIKRMKIETERKEFKFSNPTLLCNICRSTNSLFYTILSLLHSSLYSSHIHSCVEELYIRAAYKRCMYVCEESEDRNREAGRPKMVLRQRKKKGWKNEEGKKREGG